jgi:hypothetical protein
MPDVQRAFMALGVATLFPVTWTAWRAAPPDGTKWWPLILLFFWTFSLIALRHALGAESGVLRLDGPGRGQVVRGPPFARRTETLSRLTLDIDETEDGDGAAYFHLNVETPSGPLVIDEGYFRRRLEKVKERLEAAW